MMPLSPRGGRGREWGAIAAITGLAQEARLLLHNPAPQRPHPHPRPFPP